MALKLILVCNLPVATGTTMGEGVRPSVGRCGWGGQVKTGFLLSHKWMVPKQSFKEHLDYVHSVAMFKNDPR